MERPEHLAELCARLEDRFEYVITMGRHEEESMDDAGAGAFGAAGGRGRVPKR